MKVSKQSASELGLSLDNLIGIRTIQIVAQTEQGYGLSYEAAMTKLMQVLDEEYPSSDLILVKAEITRHEGVSGYHSSYGAYRLKLQGDVYKLPRNIGHAKAY